MNEREIKFLHEARAVIADNPQMLSAMIQAATGGIDKQIEVANQRAADFEVVAALMKAAVNEKRLTAETKAYYNDTICKKLERWQGKTALNWSDDNG